jgi:ABC-type protease/lipase transport system fused ATPase/permease subunit
MSRFKVALGLVVIAAAVILTAIAIFNSNVRSRRASESEPKATEYARSGESIASGAKKPPAQASDSDAFLKSLVKSGGESDRTESNAPRMQRKQIKMH